MTTKQKNIAIIPARGGSKRIPHKNIKVFFGKPIIAYSIETALQSGLFDEVMVSTDDTEIAEIAKQYGAKVPFLRTVETADDYATLSEVVVEVISQYQTQLQQSFEHICCLLPTAPFIQPEDLKNTFDTLINKEVDAVFPVVKYTFPIQRAMQFEGDYIKMIWPENLTKRSQDLQQSYHDAGLFYWIKNDVFIKGKSLWTQKTTAVVIDEAKAQDIDTPEDWQMAELKYKILYGNK